MRNGQLYGNTAKTIRASLQEAYLEGLLDFARTFFRKECFLWIDTQMYLYQIASYVVFPSEKMPVLVAEEDAQ